MAMYEDEFFRARNDTGPTVTFSLPLGLPMKGWFFNTLPEPGTENDDPVYFHIHGSHDLNNWQLLATAVQRLVVSSSHEMYEMLHVPHMSLDTRRGASLIFDSSPTVAWFLYRVVRTLSLSIIFIGAVLFGCLNKGHLAHVTLITGQVISTSVHLAALVLCFINGQQEYGREMATTFPVGYIPYVHVYIHARICTCFIN
jgi:hypothetical protein